MTKNDVENDYPYEYPPGVDGLDQCVVCGVCFGAEDDRTHVTQGHNLTYGPVYDADTGARYEYVDASDPGTRLSHPDCFKKLDAERKAAANQSLDEFGE